MPQSNAIPRSLNLLTASIPRRDLNMVRREGFDFSFDPAACERCLGYCCTGEPGCIWVNEQEISKIADYLGEDISGFISRYLSRIGRRFIIKEVKIAGSFHCLFFDKETGKCAIYDVRPAQCKTFPFWEYFRDNPEEAVKECPGVRKTPATNSGLKPAEC
jgi:Fe-S-cluster containining protein